MEENKNNNNLNNFNLDNENDIHNMKNNTNNMDNNVNSFTNSTNNIDNNMNSFTNDTNSINNNVNSFTNGTNSINNNMNSFTNSTNNIDNNVNSFTNGTNNIDNNVNSFTNGTNNIDNNMNSFTNGTNSINNNMNSFTNGTNNIDNNINSINSNNNLHKDFTQKNNISKLISFILVFLIAIIILSGAYVIIKKIFINHNGYQTNNNGSTSFFIKNKDNKYALFNENGKQLTKFEFSEVTPITLGTSLVTKDGKNALLSDKGKIIVDYTKDNESLVNNGVLFELENSKGRYLLNQKGKKVFDLSKYSRIGTDYNNFDLISNSETNEYLLVDYLGKTFAKFKHTSDATSPDYFCNSNYMVVYYDKVNYIYSLDGKLIGKFNSEEKYNISDDDDSINGNYFLSGKMENGDTDYKLIVNDQIVDIDAECSSMGVEGIDDYFYCRQDGITYYVKDNGKLGISTKNKSFVDNETYASYTQENLDKVDFYKNGKVVNSVSCAKLTDFGANKANAYLLEFTPSMKCNNNATYYAIYNLDGKLINKFDSNFFVKDLNENNIAIVTERYSSPYLATFKGEKISENYDVLYQNKPDNYIIKNKNNLYGLLDYKTGKVILEPKFKNINTGKIKDKYIYIAETDDGKFQAYDYQTHKMVLESEKRIIQSYDYLYVQDDSDNKTYYTYKGKLFYSDKE